MNDTVYYISEASKKVEVEPHVLRYWEDELKLPIGRNEMGHRCYSEKDIETLRRIKWRTGAVWHDAPGGQICG